MEGRDHNDNGQYPAWWVTATNPQPPPSSQPPENNNSHCNVNNVVSFNPTSQQSQNLRYPFYQNPNPQSIFVQNPILQNPTTQNQPSDVYYSAYPYNRLVMEPVIFPNASPSFDPFVRGQNPENGLSRQLNQPAPPTATPRHYQYPSFDQFVRDLCPESSLSRLNQSVTVPRYSLTNSSQTSLPLQNYETIDLESGFESLRINDLGLSRPNNSTALRNLASNNGFPLPQGIDQFRNIEPNYGNSTRGFLYNHLGSTTNGSQSVNSSAAAALSSRHDNSYARLRPNRASYSSIVELRGRIVLAAKDEQGCRFLQKKVDERNPIDIQIILSELKDDNLHELMRHQSANYLIQKLIGVLNEEQLTRLILSIVGSQQRFFRTCDDLTGSRVIQKLLDSSEYPQRQPLTPEQKSLLVSALKKITVPLSNSTHGNHVIKRCLQKFPYEYTKHLLEEVTDNCLNLATDRSGCCLLQDCIKYAQDEQKGRLIADVVSNALFLSDHSYGNYVVQNILGLKIPQVTADLLAQFAGNYFTLSQGKCSSNVVEKCISESGEEQSTGIINELVRHPEIFELMLHPFGNYVIQTAWTASEGRRIRQTLHALVEMNSPFLQSHIYGKKVLSKVRGNRNSSSYNRVPL